MAHKYAGTHARTTLNQIILELEVLIKSGVVDTLNGSLMLSTLYQCRDEYLDIPRRAFPNVRVLTSEIGITELRYIDPEGYRPELDSCLNRTFCVTQQGAYIETSCRDLFSITSQGDARILVWGKGRKAQFVDLNAMVREQLAEPNFEPDEESVQPARMCIDNHGHLEVEVGNKLVNIMVRSGSSGFIICHGHVLITHWPLEV